MGFKLHLIINTKGQIIAARITQGNVDDRDVVRDMTENLSGKMAGDKGYISKSLFDDIFRRGLKIITSIKTNMRNYLFLLQEKILLRKRSVIESVFNIMKNHMNLEHTRHRSPINFLVNAISCLVAYQFKTNKPKIKNTQDCGDKTSNFFTEKLLGFGVELIPNWRYQGKPAVIANFKKEKSLATVICFEEFLVGETILGQKISEVKSEEVNFKIIAKEALSSLVEKGLDGSITRRYTVGT